jgi:hypothetical protein
MMMLMMLLLLPPRPLFVLSSALFSAIRIALMLSSLSHPPR